MKSDHERVCFELIWVIVNFGKGSKVMHAAKKCGVTGGTIILAKGTANDKFADFLGLSDIRKEIVLMVSNKKMTRSALDRLDKKFNFKKPNHGIAFTTGVSEVIGSVGCKATEADREEGGEEAMHCAITAVVDKGKAEDVIDAATAAGSRGGTIINARGSGIHETSKLFFMDVEPEKEIVMILSEKKDAEAIISSIREKLDIEQPGKGIIFVQEVSKVYGLA
ncbi:MAG: P-II family nitrogen regulator [Synergistaceae bacterium]|jgi:nitrogen regulatory protein PII|nr:P-II family nitrogen regulator [Synergistaceae bacterium]MDD3673446.1 P-II family nitrogen regulator [Synergistaceae bacterium]MDD3964400.1 P-II family nitrogen regulator [Synergistaceae bacterium]MDY0283901.1 P-II family nitrogen regulator [Synergistaceae bacterium]